MEEPNPPSWPDSVLVLRDTEDAETLKSKIAPTEDVWSDEHSTYTCEHHFSDRRWAVLFAPGVYRGLSFEVGYYTQVCGLGTSPDDVQFRDGKGPFVPALNRHLHKDGAGTCLDTFWRSGENFANFSEDGMMWAVSQAAPLRRVHVANDLFLHDKAAYASGGHLANCVIDNHTHFGGQQQYLSRNVHFGNGSSGGAWGMVYVGCPGAPPPSPGDDSSAASTVVESPPVRIEKPYVALREDGTKFQLRVPRPTIDDTSRPHTSGELEESRDFSRVRVAKASEPLSRIQEALDEGKDVVLSPGIYYLEETLEIKRSNQVLLGLGLATLAAPIGRPCIRVAPRTPGVRVAGVMLEAPAVDPTSRPSTGEGSGSSNPNHWSLLEWGAEGVVNDFGDASNPGSMFDVFCRVGGATTDRRDWISIDTMVRIHSGHVVGDNLWLWRADHGELGDGEDANCPHVSPVFWQTEESEFRVETGIEVTGNDVTIFGLAVEHANGHQTVWKGERGSVFFYQCEFPYDVGPDFGANGYRGYLVDDGVTDHKLYSPGIYSNFRNEPVHVDTAIQHPDRPGVQVHNPFTVHLDNHGLIRSVVNGKGPATVDKGTPTRIRSQ